MWILTILDLNIFYFKYFIFLLVIGLFSQAKTNSNFLQIVAIVVVNIQLCTLIGTQQVQKFDEIYGCSLSMTRAVACMLIVNSGIKLT